MTTEPLYPQKKRGRRWLSKRLPLKKAIAAILITTLMITGGAFFCFSLYQYILDQRAHQDDYLIEAIVQTGPEKEQLKTLALAEFLGLSMDKPLNLYLFNSKEAEKTLKKHPLIKYARVKKVSPAIIYIDYAIRKPVAFLGDYSNTALDEEGTAIPFKPFFSPKKLTTIYLGIKREEIWGEDLRGEHLSLAYAIIKQLEQVSDGGIQLQSIDLRKAYAKSYGNREIVLKMMDHFYASNQGRSTLVQCPTYLRMTEQILNQWLEYYLKLRETVLVKRVERLPITAAALSTNLPPLVIDLRVDNLAFLSQCGNKSGQQVQNNGIK